MKLNQDCIRDLMLYVEENGELGNFIQLNDKVVDDLGNYDIETIIYTAQKLNDAGYFNIEEHNALSASYPLVLIKSITYEGHLFLDNIRDDNTWNQVKKRVSDTARSMSIEIMSTAAAELACRQLGI